MTNRRASLMGRLTVVVVWVGLASCQAQPMTSSSSLTPHPSSTPTAGFSDLPGVTEGALFDHRPEGVGNMACSGGMLAWTTGSLDALYISGLDAPVSPRLVAGSATSRQIGPLQFSFPWLAYAEYTQAGEGQYLADWRVRVVDVRTGHVADVAKPSSAVQRQELPMPTVDGNSLVWDVLLAPGHKALMLHDLVNGVEREIRLPAGTYPVRPSIRGGRVAFLDNGVDPHNQQEFWLSRGGRPDVLDLGTGQVTPLDGGPDSSFLLYDGQRAAWVASPAHAAVPTSSAPTTGPTQVSSEIWVQQAGAPGHRVLGRGLPTMALDDQVVLWFIEDQRSLVAAVAGHPPGLVHLDAPGSPGGLALCGKRLYFGGVDSTIKYLDLP